MLVVRILPPVKAFTLKPTAVAVAAAANPRAVAPAEAWITPLFETLAVGTTPSRACETPTAEAPAAALNPVAEAWALALIVPALTTDAVGPKAATNCATPAAWALAWANKSAEACGAA